MKILILSAQKFINITLGLGVILFTVSLVQAAQINVPADHPMIQYAVDAAADGDTIVVADGWYFQNVVVDKPLTIRSENGHAVTFLQVLNTSASGFMVLSDDVTIQGFTISGVAVSGPAAVYIAKDVKNCTITENHIGTSGASNVYGIYLREASGNTISYNICEANSDYGIVFYRSNDNRVNNNVSKGRSTYGIYLWESDNNTLDNNEFNSSANAGGYLWASHSNQLSSNTFSDNLGRGVFLRGNSTGNIIDNNFFSENNNGLQLYDSHSNIISRNTCQANGISGIVLLDGSSDNEISDNTCEDHPNNAGIRLIDSDLNRISNNTLFHNFKGIGLQRASANQIFLNHCFENDDGGIVLIDDSQFNAVYSNQSERNADGGIKLYDSTNNRIWDNFCNANDGSSIGIYSSSDNMLMRNTFSNSSYGIFLDNSNNNAVYLNSIINNTTQNIYSVSSVNEWQTPQAVSYFFQGTPYASFLGNFYDDHIGVDLDGNGLTDEPKDLPNTEPDDDSPLIMAHENFIVNPGNLDYDAEIDGHDLALFAIAYSDNTITADLNQNTISDTQDVERFADHFGQDI